MQIHTRSSKTYKYLSLFTYDKRKARDLIAIMSQNQKQFNKVTLVHVVAKQVPKSQNLKKMLYKLHGGLKTTGEYSYF